MKLAILAILPWIAPVLVHAQRSPAPLCDTLSGLEKEAALSRKSARIIVFADEPMEFACGHAKNAPAQLAFCSAAMEAVGLEFKHMFPWRVADCLRGARVHPGTKEVAQYTGTNWRKITHLTAGWPDGVRIDIRHVPRDDAGDPSPLKGYYGRYEMVVWKPSNTPPQ